MSRRNATRHKRSTAHAIEHFKASRRSDTSQLTQPSPSMAAPVEERALLEIEVVQWVILVRQLMHIAPGTSAIGLRRCPAGHHKRAV